MKITGSEALFNVQKALNKLNQSTNSIKTNFAANQQSLDQSSRELADALSQTRAGYYDSSIENVELSQIWQRARDWGLGEQTEMALEARDTALRAANEVTMTEADLQVANKEIAGMQAETTRIGLTNNINGSHTLARHGDVEVVEEIEKIIEIEEEQVNGTKPQIDVLWVVDRSGSMGDKIAYIKRDASKMYAELEAKGFDVRMAIESFEASLDSNGSTDFKSTAAEFEADVSKVLSNIYGGIERGLTSIEQAMQRFGDKFDPNAAKVTILLTDEATDDFAQAADLTQGAPAEQFRQRVAIL